MPPPPFAVLADPNSMFPRYYRDQRFDEIAPILATKETGQNKLLGKQGKCF
jgi:hypothetical protein